MRQYTGCGEERRAEEMGGKGDMRGGERGEMKRGGERRLELESCLSSLSLQAVNQNGDRQKGEKYVSFQI